MVVVFAIVGVFVVVLGIVRVFVIVLVGNRDEGVPTLAGIVSNGTCCVVPVFIM